MYPKVIYVIRYQILGALRNGNERLDLEFRFSWSVADENDAEGTMMFAAWEWVRPSRNFLIVNSSSSLERLEVNAAGISINRICRMGLLAISKVIGFICYTKGCIISFLLKEIIQPRVFLFVHCRFSRCGFSVFRMAGYCLPFIR